VNIPDYAFNEGTLAYYRDVAKFDETISERERRALLADPLAHHYIGMVAVIKRAFPEKNVEECRAFYEDDRNWIGTKCVLGNYIFAPKNEEFAKRFFEEFNKKDLAADKIPERKLFEFLERERGFRWVWFGNVWNGVCPYVDEGEPKKAYRVTLSYEGTTELRVCAVDAKSAYEQAKTLSAKGELGDAIINDERTFKLKSMSMGLEQ
jgi:hypothetical protein